MGKHGGKILGDVYFHFAQYKTIEPFDQFPSICEMIIPNSHELNYIDEEIGNILKNFTDQNLTFALNTKVIGGDVYYNTSDDIRVTETLFLTVPTDTLNLTDHQCILNSDNMLTVQNCTDFQPSVLCVKQMNKNELTKINMFFETDIGPVKKTPPNARTKLLHRNIKDPQSFFQRVGEYLDFQ
ncbi:hypothetical protein SNEBB_002588 [Seison nebaliae]|nr:hypothetical protein SNEBB_002588 [Seison nebaliae]